VFSGGRNNGLMTEMHSVKQPDREKYGAT